MATDLTQDAVLNFIQSSGGSVKNSELLLHFGNFIRDHADRDRNRELFKRFVNSVATVRQDDGVSYVVLRKQFRGQVPGGGGGSAGPRLPVGRISEPSPQNTNLSAQKSRLKPHLEETTPAPSGETASKTILPAAGIAVNNNNNNVKTNFNLKQKNTFELSGQRVAAQAVRQVTEKTELKTPSLSEPPARDQYTKGGQQRVGPLHGITPVAPAIRHHGETSQQAPVPQTLKGGEACPQPARGLLQEPPLRHVSLEPEVTPRRIRYRPSYKSAMSCDEDEEEEEEEDVPVRRSAGGAAWPLSAPLRDTEEAMSTSSPCIIAPPAPPSVVSSCSSSSSERKLPKIFIQDVEGEALAPQMEPVSLSGELMSTRHSLPLEEERYMLEPRLLHNVHQDRRYSQPAGVHLEQRLHQSQRTQLSSSHSSIFSPSSNAGSSRRSELNSSLDDLQAKTGETGRVLQIQEALQQAQGLKPESVTHLGNSKTTASPWYHSTGNLHDDQESTAHALPLHLSTGDLLDNRDEVGSSEGATSTPVLRQHQVISRRLSREVRSRMCRSLGADLDQILQEEGRGGGGSEAARLNRLYLISSSLSLRANLSSSSLSSCSTPPRCHSLAELDEGVERKGGRRSLPTTAAASTTHHEGHGRQSLVPLEPREHAWLVKGAAGAWPDIYSLFREDSSLLNKHDFISGFTVLHWIAKHGDHRVLNTLWYGVEKAGLTFDTNARSTCGHTPLHVAAMHGRKNIIRLLVKNFNADVKLRDTAGKRPWQYLSSNTPLDIFQLLGAPARAALGGIERVDPKWDHQQQQQRRRRHHLSSASSGERPLTIIGTTKVKRSTSLAAFLKHKSPFHGPV